MLSRIPPPRVHFGIDEFLDAPNQREADQINQRTSRFRDNDHRIGRGRDKQLSGRGSPNGKFVPNTEEEEALFNLNPQQKNDDPQFSGYNRLA